MEIFNGMITEFTRESPTRCFVCAESGNFTALIAFNPAELSLKELERLCVTKDKLSISIRASETGDDKTFNYTGIKAIRPSHPGYTIAFYPYGKDDGTEVIMNMSKSALGKVPIDANGIYSISVKHK